MKNIIIHRVAIALVLFGISNTLRAEEAPPESAEKIAAALPTEPFAKPQKDRKILIFSKTNGFRHTSIPTGKLAIAEIGKKTGAYEAVISDDLANFEADAIKNFDAICFLNTTLNVFSPNPEEMKTLSDEQKKAAEEKDARLKINLMAFVKSGGGFIGIHSATDTFYEWPEYNQMINGCFDGHPWGAATRVSIKVEPGQEKHPLVAMFKGENIEFAEEIYQFKEPYNSKFVQMLLRLDTEKTDMTVKGIHRTDGDFGIAWVRNWDKGRVFYCSIGHNHEVYWDSKILSHYLAGFQWALGDYQVGVPNTDSTIKNSTE